jgi:predicted DNA-binding transcriptional regulator YafY
MPKKISTDYNASEKVLRMFIKLLTDGRRHFQADLAEEFQCSPQTIGRLAAEIESAIGISLESGIENRRRYYQIRSLKNRGVLQPKYEELRYLSICRDLAEHILPEEVAKRVDKTIMGLSVLMADSDYADREKVQKGQVSFFRKGHIDYSPHQAVIERLLQAIEEKRVCIVHYKAAGKDEAREHRVLPGKLISQNNALYLLGAILTPRNELKSLTNMAVHRILEVDLTDKTSAIDLPPADSALFGLPWHEPRQVRIQFQPGKVVDYVRERMWSVEQKIEDLPDGGIILEIMSQSDEELMSWVRGFGDKAQLISE